MYTTALERNFSAISQLESILFQIDDPTAAIVLGKVALCTGPVIYPLTRVSTTGAFKEATKILKAQRLSGFTYEDVENAMQSLSDEVTCSQ